VKALLVTLVFAPLLGAVVAGLFGRRIGDKPSMAVTTGLLFLSCALSWYTFAQVAWGQWTQHYVFELLPFIGVGDFQSAWSIRLDTLSAVMLIVVTSVSFLVHLYSWGYMADDDSKPRFFAYLSLFTFAMLMLVTSADFMQLFFGWEGVGLASYLLIGFWFKKPTANAASIKAFVVNRVGDFGFALGIMTVFWMFHTIRFAELFPLIASKAHASWTFAGANWSALDLAGFLLFIGAAGKSAQFFLHVWLPDAMEGPTPVSALIHAATMVTAGVYMLCLLSPLYEYAPVAREIVTIIGAVTCLFAATVGLAQNDIKRVIAYSTCSQLGYMFFAAGLGVYQAAMFHLFTHAFFKALLFLGAGSVIHGMHHEQDMRRMGALAGKLPITFAVMLIGTIAITGLGIPGLDLGFAGFYSKDAILAAAFEAGHSQAYGYFAYIIGTFVAGLTAYYSWRLAFMTFNGSPKWAHASHGDSPHGAAVAHPDHSHASSAQIETHSEPDTNPEPVDHHGHDDAHGHGHGGFKPHESPWVMLLPLLVLSVGAIFAGGVFTHLFIGEGREGFWRGAIFTAPQNTTLEHIEHLPQWVGLLPLGASVLGLLIAAYYYLLHEGLAARMAANNGLLYRFLYNKWYVDEVYQFIFVRGAKALGDLFWKGGDQAIIDGLGPNGVANVSSRASRGLSVLQSGYLYHYAFVMLLGVAGLLTYAMWAWTH
jgi:NADH-quinone oxidoreductase subunit L